MVKTRILFYVITAISLLAVFSCAENNDPEDKPVEPKPQAGTYTVTIVAGKEAVGTKALSLEGGTLKAVWAVNEEVSVFNETKGAALTGTLKAQSAGTSTTLKGELKGVTIDKNDKLTLQFLSPSYNTQDGTLEYIAAHCDYATANVTVTEVSGSNISTDQARFINQQAFVKILLTEPDGQDRYAPFNPQSLTIKYGEGSIELSSIPASTWSSNGAGVVYVAIPAINDGVLSLEAAKTTICFMKRLTSPSAVDITMSWMPGCRILSESGPKKNSEPPCRRRDTSNTQVTCSVWRMTSLSAKENSRSSILIPSI